VCFSPEADLVTGVVVGVVAVDAIRHAPRREQLPLAAIPVVLAGHSLVEVLVWRGLQGDASAAVWRPALWIYLLIAFSVLPVLVPVAVGALEPEARRRRVAAFTFVGAVVSIVLTEAIVRGPVSATIEGHHIDYEVGLAHGGAIVGLYLLATCGTLLLSSRRPVRWFGVANLSAAGVLIWVDKSAFISLWCAWAAVASLTIAVHLRRVEGLAADPADHPAYGPDHAGFGHRPHRRPARGGVGPRQ
jgi:hypothetical protein